MAAHLWIAMPASHTPIAPIGPLRAHPQAPLLHVLMRTASSWPADRHSMTISSTVHRQLSSPKIPMQGVSTT